MREGRDIRLIDADALANYANNQIVGITANDIMRFPTVDAEPVKRGRWIMNNPYGVKVCSLCGYGRTWGAENYCAECGARMDSDTK